MLKLHFDGSCWPNPGGKAGYGFIVSESGEVVKSETGSVGNGPRMTNNLAEFEALYKGLEWINIRYGANSITGTAFHNPDKYLLNVYGDSQLIINIAKGRYRATPGKLYYPAYERANNVLKEMRRQKNIIIFDWVPRAQNKEADKISRV
jgi:ribonuclease HI